MMVRLIVNDHGVEVPNRPQRIEINTDGEVLYMHELRDLLYERLGLEAHTYTLVNAGFLDGPEPSEIDLHRKLDADVNVAVLTTYKGEIFHSVLTAGTTVEEYRRFIARRFLVRPALQVLSYMKLLMEDDDRLGTYADAGPVRICLQVKQEMARPDKVFISVKRRRAPGYLTFVMDDVETFDMLAGRLEREGEVREGEEVTFASDGTIFDNWKTLGEYKLTRAKLRISE